MPPSADTVPAQRTVRLKTLVGLRWFAVIGQAITVFVVVANVTGTKATAAVTARANGYRTLMSSTIPPVP